MILNSYLITWIEPVVENGTTKSSEENHSKCTINPLLVIRMIIFWYNLPFLLYFMAAKLQFGSFVRSDASSIFFFTRESHGGNLYSNKMHLVLDSFDRMTACLSVCMLDFVCAQPKTTMHRCHATQVKWLQVISV